MAQDIMKATIDRLNCEYAQAYNAGQLDTVLDLFADDAITLSPDQAPVRGRDALRRYCRAGFEREPSHDLVLRSIRVDGSGDMLYDAGQWTQSLPTPEGGLLSLVGNALRTSTPEARRKIRVILGGTLVGVVPIMLALGVQDFFGFRLSFWLAAVLVLLLYLFPLSFAYAVVKHRVLEIPVLLRRSARYLLVQRGFVFLHILVSVGATVVFVWLLSRSFQSSTQFARPMGLTAGVVFGSMLALGGAAHSPSRVAAHRPGLLS